MGLEDSIIREGEEEGIREERLGERGMRNEWGGEEWGVFVW